MLRSGDHVPELDLCCTGKYFVKLEVKKFNYLSIAPYVGDLLGKNQG